MLHGIGQDLKGRDNDADVEKHSVPHFLGRPCVDVVGATYELGHGDSDLCAKNVVLLAGEIHGWGQEPYHLGCISRVSVVDGDR